MLNATTVFVWPSTLKKSVMWIVGRACCYWLVPLFPFYSLIITSTVKQFSWILQNTGFTLDMLLIPLGCCDVVLGIEWLVTLGDIT